MTHRPGPPRVAIIGAGPAGVVAARYLASSGFAPVLFDRGASVGGQWHVGSPWSGVWPGMRTNTSRITTAFSDLPHPPGLPYPTGEAIGAYLERFATQHDLLRHARLGVVVTHLDPVPGGTWCVTWTDGGGTTQREVFTRVVVASGRYVAPFTAPIPELGQFTGPGGVTHAAHYRGADPFRGQRVLVAGHSISAVEVASELALKGAASVSVAARRHRYVLQKILAGVPLEHRVYTRAAALAAETFTHEVTAASLRSLILRTSGHPTQFGAPCHADDPYEAGFTQNQYYLTLVAEGRIHPRAWVVGVEGQRVLFADGTSTEVDAIVVGTGYRLDLPFLGDAVRRALRPDDVHLDLHEMTFHPDLPGLAFVGLFEQSGPYFTPLELQARWVAYAWSGQAPVPTPDDMRAGVSAYRAQRGTPQVRRMHLVARRFATLAGVEPRLERWPHLARALLFGVLSPASYRLDGPEALPDAAEQVVRDTAAFGALDGAGFSAEERDMLRTLADARRDASFSAFVSRVT